jgi:hypothetical protein
MLMTLLVVLIILMIGRSVRIRHRGHVPAGTVNSATGSKL